MEDRETQKILEEIETGYDVMSVKFSETRKYFWRGLEFIEEYVKKGDKVLDFGCGNGRLLELFNGKNVAYFGLDISEKLLEIAKKKYPSERANFQKITGSGSLAFPENSFNAVYSVAVLHHLPGAKRRLEIVKELKRVLKPEGKVIITVWHLWQKKYIKNILQNWKDKLLGKSNWDWNDCYISFADNQGNKFQRFHHAFTKRELKRLFLAAGFKVEKCEIINKRNILLIGKK
jgi:tRNA (uracil-5-)-methyltransferase TRM9